MKTKNNNERYKFDVHCKPALTNVKIPDTITSIFNGFIARTTKICSEKFLRAEIEYLTGIFCENGHDKNTLHRIITLKRNT